ncbi:MAG: type II toxin-antitoxin system death-on-curing family toxin [Coriobacteriia bacterium]|nr:type II toxin-antitoxin system death-on-curing family toxin [Coriobacteriia bacterium]
MPNFLTIDEVLDLHALQLDHFGGLDGIRDTGLLESALAMPQAGFGEHYVHADIYEMAAAYLFHLVKNHPFIDGNKRVGFHAAFVFLALNGIELDIPQDQAYDLVIAVAEGRAEKPQVAAAVRAHAQPIAQP